jgi:pimeloyl-ACP methyl ester carboxylesterase
VVHTCTGRYRAALAHVNTEETANDLDLVRAALGDNRLNYLGFSYGTRLGATYAHLFPTHLRAMVLDGAVDPVSGELAGDERQAAGLEDAFDQFATDCRHRPACAGLPNPRGALTALVAAADRRPIPTSRKGDGRRASGGILTLAAAAALYDQGRWPALGEAMIAAQHGDAAQMFALADSFTERDASNGHYTNLLDAYTAVTCNDSVLTITDELVAEKAAAWTTRYPLFGRNAASSLYTCYGWPKSGHPLPPANAPGAPKILVVGTTHDPATPYAGAAALAGALGSGVELTWDGQGHTAYGKSRCVTAKVDSYLLTARVPAGVSCPRT